MLLWIIFQILIESLPISSSGHVMLLQRWYTKLGYLVSSEQIEQINFLLHGPALVIMVFYFFNRWSNMIVHKKIELQDFCKISTYQKFFSPFLFIILADIVTVIFWKMKIFQTKFLETYFLTIGFTITALLLYATKFMQGKKEVGFIWWHGIIIGLAQSFALLPGISRFAITFFAGRYLGYAPDNSFAISFLVQLPLILAACIKGLLEIYDNDLILNQVFNFWTLIAIVPLTYVSYKVMCLVGNLIDQNKIWYFSMYMIIPIVVSILL